MRKEKQTQCLEAQLVVNGFTEFMINLKEKIMREVNKKKLSFAQGRPKLKLPREEFPR